MTTLKINKFKLLVKEHKNRIFNYAQLMLKNRMDADDIAQEVLIRVWNNIDNFNLLAAKSYIMKITHNLCIDYLRRNKVSASREIEMTEVFEETYVDNRNANDTVKNIDFKILETKIKSILERMPDNLKSIFVLYDIEGYKYKEISKILDIPENSVKVYLFRARKYLQEELKNYERN